MAASSITHDILKAAVAKEHGCQPNEVNIQNLTLKSGSNAFDGFLCDITAADFDVLVRNQLFSKHYICKHSGGPDKAPLVSQNELFDVECNVYSDLIPKLQAIRMEKKLDEIPFPKCFYASKEDQIIVMENLRWQKYTMTQKKIEPLSLSSIKLILEALASLHATSYYFIQKYPGGMEALKGDFKVLFDADSMEDAKESLSSVILGMNKSLVHLLRFVHKDEMADRLEAFQPKLFDTYFSILNSMGKLNCFIHCDAWYNNFMYRRPTEDSSQEPDEVCMLDLQSINYGRLGLDLAYFMSCSLSPTQKKLHFDDLITFYHEHFHAEIHSLDPHMPTLFSVEELVKEYDACFPYAFIFACGHIQGLFMGEHKQGNDQAEKDPEFKMENRFIEICGQIEAKLKTNPELGEPLFYLVQEAIDKKVI